MSNIVMPAKAGIQGQASCPDPLDTGFHRYDGEAQDVLSPSASPASA
jgi:hypothetical protein